MLLQLTSAAALASSGCGTTAQWNEQVFTRADERFLDELERASFLFFRECAHPKTGLVKDRDKATGATNARVASIAATGFGLSAWCLADERKWVSRAEACDYALKTLRFIARELHHEHGFYFHFIDWATGERVWKCEVSSIDTAILLCGVLTCRAHFQDAEVRALASEIYDRADFDWMRNGGVTLTHGWKPESGFLNSRWSSYCELMMLYLLALGSNRHAISADAWHAWKRPKLNYAGEEFIYDPHAPLFIHQYSHAWFDFRDKRDIYADYFENSVKATRAHREFCASLSNEFPHYNRNFWGISASDSAKGYTVWGGPPRIGRIDGTLVPCAVAGSLPFLPRECAATLRLMRERFGDRIWKRYGFVDAFNPATAWVAPDVIGIDLGITLMMAENARTGFFNRTFMRNPEPTRGMQRAGFLF
ncbi:MAG TPA: glucoamylase family protein [Candidatus Acidoferrum sp.]|nr:glucoamylase family protein [Candidatus Acidoferrum sp.]